MDAFQPTMPERYAWSFPTTNFSHILSIYGGHFMDVLFQAVGFPKKLTAVVENQFPFITIEQTGKKIPNTNPNEVMVIGTLEAGGNTILSPPLTSMQACKTWHTSTPRTFATAKTAHPKRLIFEMHSGNID